VKLVSAQNTPEKNISVNFQQTKIEPFVDELEAKSGYHFYVDTAQFDSLKITLQADNKPLSVI
jgi:type II secretory pathway component GspD/PulD (secretin)